MSRKKVKWSRVLVVGGSKEYAGAVYLAAITALRSGAESVVVMAPEKVAWALNALSPDLVTRKLRGEYLSMRHLPTIRKQLRTTDVLVLGNGATTRAPTASLMRRLMKWAGPKVIDADALKVLHGGVENAILTPNEGEWALLKTHADVHTILRSSVIVKKGFPTELWAGRVRRPVKTNKGLSKAGMGDVLAGLCAGQLARGLSFWDAALAACKLGNEAAQVLTRKKRGYHFLASDIAGELRKIRG